MAILNITPDSFYDGGKYLMWGNSRAQFEKYFEQGADIIDIGAYSSRPGAKHIDTDEEQSRLKPLLEFILKFHPEIVVSLDTFRSEIASWAVKEYGVSIINDISAGEMDKKMFETIAELQVPYILMHMQGTPDNMQLNPGYKNVVEDIILYFSRKLELLKKLGVHDIIIDPGFGFGKSIEHNYQLLNNLNEFRIFDLPVLAGLSRKSMIYKFLGNAADEALNGTTVLNTLALLNGASLIRVHDVVEARQTILLVQKCLSAV